MSKIEDGGSAFPGLIGPPSEYARGMTLRDYFAIHAPYGEITSYLRCWVGGEFIERSHQAARYIYADAMLAARKKEA